MNHVCVCGFHEKYWERYWSANKREKKYWEETQWKISFTSYKPESPSSSTSLSSSVITMEFLGDAEIDTRWSEKRDLKREGNLDTLNTVNIEYNWAIVEWIYEFVVVRDEFNKKESPQKQLLNISWKLFGSGN